MAQVDQALEVRQDKAPELRLADLGAALCAEVVADEEDVDDIRRRFEDTPANLGVIIHAVLQHGVNNRRRVIHLQQQVFHAQQIDGVMPEGRPFPAHDGVLPAVLQRFRPDVGNIHPVRVGPGVGVDLSGGCGGGEGVAHWLAAFVAVAQDAERRAVSRAGGQVGVGRGVIRASVDRQDAPEVIADGAMKAFVIRQVQEAPRFGGKGGRSPQPGRYMIRLSMVEGCQYPFS